MTHSLSIRHIGAGPESNYIEKAYCFCGRNLVQPGIHTEPQEVSSGANAVNRISRIYCELPNNVHIASPGESGQHSEGVPAYETPGVGQT